MFVVLAYFIWRRSFIALGLAIFLYALDTLLLWLTDALSVRGLILRIVLLLGIARAFDAIDLLKRHKRTQAADRTRAA